MAVPGALAEQGNIWQCLCMKAGERGRASSVEQQVQKSFLTFGSLNSF